MSVEALLGSRAERIMTETKSIENKGKYKKSPVYLTAAAFWRQGRKGLREITEDLQRNGINFDSDKSGFDQLPNAYKHSAYLNFSAGIFGITMIFNERALIEKEVNLKYLTLAYNIAFCKTLVPWYDEPEKEVEKLSDKQHQDLLHLVDIKHPDRANRSLSSLYSDKIDLMPRAIRDDLEKSKTLPFIKKFFLQRYDWLVTELINLNARQSELKY